MQYTFSKKANQKVEKDMKVICQEIKKRIPNVLSIIFSGGFSRGEGAVKIENGRVYPYNDYDILVVSREKLSKDKADKFSVEISRKLGYNGISLFYPLKKEEQKMKENFYIDLKCSTPKELKKLLPRLRTYELKNSSRILYGGDLRHLIPDYNLKEIPLSEGAKLLLDRMSQMVEYYSTKGKYDKEFLIYIIQQAYAACCTSLLLLSGKYQIGYTKNMEIFKKYYKKDFPELSERLENLDKKIEQFTKWKLKPGKLPKNIEEEWFIARRNILEVSKYFLEKFLNKDISNLDELSKAISGMRKEFYSPYIRSIIKNRTNIEIGILTNLFLPLVSFLFKYKYHQRLKKFGIKKLGIFLENSPDLIIFSSLIFIIGSISEKGIDREVLNKGRNLLNKAYPSGGKEWEDVSMEYANAYVAFFLQEL